MDVLNPIWAIRSAEDIGVSLLARQRAEETLPSLRGDALREFLYNNFAGHYEQHGSRAVMSIRGPLMESDYERIQGNLEKLKNDKTVKALILDIRSPGGSVSGSPETAEMVRGFGKPTAAFACGMMASAAYWIGSQADEVAAQSSCSVGSIGVVASHVSMEKFLKEAGIETTEIAMGKKKALFSPNHALTEEGKKELTAQVSHFYSVFKDAVLSKRKELSEECLQSGIYYGKEAVDKGLVDGIITNMSELTKG